MRLQVSQHVIIEIDRQMQLGVFAEELAALAVGKVVFGSHGCLVALVLSLFLAGGFTGGNQPQFGGVLAGLLGRFWR